MRSRYKVEYSFSSREDIKNKRKYIIKTFKYLELGKSFTQKIREAKKRLEDAPLGYHGVDLEYRGYDIRLLVHKNYMLFYTVDVTSKTIYVLRVLQEGMDWMRIIKKWVKEHEND